VTRIKICGLTNREDVLVAVEAGADALGFIAVPNTPRYVSPEMVREITQNLPPFITKVIVVQKPTDAIAYSSDVIQYYNDDIVNPGNNIRRIRVFRIKNEDSLQAMAEYRDTPEAILLDTHHESLLGGVGVTFNWDLALKAKTILTGIPMLLAGGLTPENVGEAIQRIRPYGVDISSGVEIKPGQKDHNKIRRFIEAARQASF